MKEQKKELSLSSAEEYKDWIKSISTRYRQCQIKAAVSGNRELIAFYWSLGQEIVQREAEKKYGSGFYTALSRDLKELIPGVKGFASSNLRYMAKFYSLYMPVIFPQVVEKSENEKFPQVVGELSEEDLFAVPWGHHRMIIDRCREDMGKAVLFVKKTIQNNWSRAVLENFLDTDLYDRQGKAISNFAYALPAPQSDLAQEMTKDLYNFDFLTIQEDYNERQLKAALVENVIRFLMELGKGFAFVGKEYTLPI